MKKKKILLIFILCIVIIISIFIIANKIKDNKNISLIKKEIPLVLDTKMDDIYNSNDAKEYGISNIKYEITNIFKQKRSGYGDTQYTVKITISCEANNNLSDIEKSLVAYQIEKLVDDIDSVNGIFKISNGAKVSVRNATTHNVEVISIVNDEIIHSTSNTSAPSKKNNSTNRDQDAWNCATDVVENKLSHYSNVKVSSYGNSTVTYTSSTDIYTIKGTVSYTNEYGAKVNYKFTVNLQLTENGYKNSSVLIY